MRKATESDMTDLLEMGRRFHDAVGPEWPWSDDGFTRTMQSVIDDGFLVRTNAGFLAAFIAPMPLNPDWMVAHELLWWSEDGSGAELQRAFRVWAKSMGANEIKWSCRADNDRVKRFYTRFADPCEAVFSEKL